MDDETLLGLLSGLGFVGVFLFGWAKKDTSELRKDHEELAKAHNALSQTVASRKDLKDEIAPLAQDIRDMRHQLNSAFSHGRYQSD